MLSLVINGLRELGFDCLLQPDACCRPPRVQAHHSRSPAMFFQQTFRLFTLGVAVFLSMAAQGSPTPFRGIAFSPLDGEFALFDDIYLPIDVENVNPK